MEYAKEISDPVNRQRYEEEITQMERERGQDVKFLHPKVHLLRKSLLLAQIRGAKFCNL